MTEETRVLVVDDDESLAASLAEALKKNGYIADTKSGKEAIERSKIKY